MMKISKALANHAVDELLQMGYTINGDALTPPERLSDFACKFFGVTHAQASPAGWTQMRIALAMVMLGFASRDIQGTQESALKVLDSVTEPGHTLSVLRHAPDWRMPAPVAGQPAEPSPADLGEKT